MIELKDITFKEYFDLEYRTEYDYAIRYAYSFLKPIDHFNLGDFMQLHFGIVKDIQYDYFQGLSWEQFYDYMKQIKDKDISKEKLIIVCQAKSYLVSEIIRLSEIESIALAHEPSDDEERAGMDRFKDLGVYLQIRSLTGGDVTKNELVRSMKYEDCFVELVTQKALKDYDRELTKIIRDNQNISN